jgi:glycerophosphoryl diester phosphodiesterase
MKKYLFLLFAIAAQSVVAQNKIMVTAHRGDWRNEPENSLRAFKSAAAMGVDMVELDLKKTKDGVIVIMHDDDIDRTSNGHGKPADYTLDELKKFRLKNGMGRVTAYNAIPTLEEVMLALKGTNVMVNLDKSFDYYQETYDILIKTGTLKHMKLYSFEFVFTRDTSAVLADNKFITNTGTKIFINALWPSLNAGHDDDLAVEQGDKKNSWDWIINHGATIIQTDRPQLMLDYLRSRHLHK